MLSLLEEKVENADQGWLQQLGLFSRKDMAHKGILLLVEVATATGRIVFLDVPAAIGVGDYMM